MYYKTEAETLFGYDAIDLNRDASESLVPDFLTPGLAPITYQSPHIDMSDGAWYGVTLEFTPIPDSFSFAKSPIIQQMSNPSPLGTLSDFLTDAQNNVLFVRSGVTKARETMEVIEDALDTFAKIEKSADKVEKTLEGLAKAMKLVAKVPALKVIADGLQKVFKDMAAEVRKLEKEARDIDKKIEDRGWKDDAEDARLELEGYEGDLQFLAQEIGEARETVDTADAVYGLIIAHSSDVEAGIGTALANPNALFADTNSAFNVNLNSVTTLVGNIDSSFDGITGLLNLATGLSNGISSIARALSPISGPLEILSKAIRPIEWALDAVGFIFNTFVAPILDPIFEALGINRLFNAIKDKLLGLFPDLSLISNIEDPLTDIFDDLTDGLISGISVDLTGLTDGFTAILDEAYQILPGDEVVFVDRDDTLAGTEPTGGDGNDLITGNRLDNTLIGGAGDDALTPGGGNDFIDGGDGTNDAVIFAGNIGEYRITRVDADTLEIIHAQPPIGAVDQGRNTIINTEKFIFADLTLTLDDLNNIEFLDPGENFTGDLERNFVFGGSGDEIIIGGGGDDFLQGGAGDDWLQGGDGDDVLASDSGNDTLDGGDGFDTISFDAQSSGARLFLYRTGVTDTSRADLTPSVAITHYGFSIEQVIGSDFNDWLYGDDNVNIILGGGANDIIRGLGGDDQLTGGDGLDYLFGDDGDDILSGGDGKDYYFGGTGDNTFIDTFDEYDAGVAHYGAFDSDGAPEFNVAGTPRRVLQLTKFFENPDEAGLADYIIHRPDQGIVERYDANDGLIGTDTLIGLSDVVGTDGDDIFLNYTQLPSEWVDIGYGTIRSYGGGGDDIFYIHATLTNGRAIDNIFFGDDGDDTFIYTNDGERTAGVAGGINGGNGYDVADFSLSSEGVNSPTGSIVFSSNIQSLVLLPLSEIEHIILTELRDEYTAGDDLGIERIDAGHGDDVIDLAVVSGNAGAIYGEEGDDTLTASGIGSVHLIGGLGDDTLIGNGDYFGGPNLYEGGEGDDIFFGSFSQETFDGGDGIDLIDFSLLNGQEHNDSVFVDLILGSFFDPDISSDSPLSDGDTFLNIENVTGGQRLDVIYGTAGANVIRGLGQADELFGRGGDDTIFGGSGNDDIYGETNQFDSLSGDPSAGIDGNDVLYGGLGTNDLYGGGGSDTAHLGFDGELYGRARVEMLTTGQYAANVIGENSSTVLAQNRLNSIENISTGALDDIVFTDDNANTIRTGSGDDIARGRGGDDFILGGDGDDILDGGAGDDFLIGGRGRDTIYGGFGVDTLDYSSNSGALVIDLTANTATETYSLDKRNVWADTLTDEARYSAANDGFITPQMVFESDPINANSPGDLNISFEEDFLEEINGQVVSFALAVEIPVWADTGTSEARYSTVNDAMVTPIMVFESDPNNANSDGDLDISLAEDFLEDQNGTIVDFSVAPEERMETQDEVVVGVENVTGGFGDDTIIGDSQDNILIGNGGDDTLWGGIGSDTLIGGEGDDILLGNAESTAQDYGFVALNYGGDDVRPDGSFGGNTGDYLVVNNAVMPTHEWTVQIVYRATELERIDVNGNSSGGAALFAYAVEGSQNEIILYAPDNGNIQVYLDGSTTVTTDIPSEMLFDGRTHHLSLSYQVLPNGTQAQFKLFIDGASAYESGLLDKGPITSGGRWVIGQEQDDHIDTSSFATNQILVGDVADFRIYDDVRSASEIADDAQGLVDLSDPNLVENWVFDDGIVNRAGTQVMELVGGSLIQDSLISDNVFEGGAGADVITGGDGFDMAIYARSDEGVNINLSTQTASGGEADGDVISSIDGVEGSDSDDILRGHDFDNTLLGNQGNDSIRGLGGDDFLRGGAGDDVIFGNAGADRLYGDNGNDDLDGGGDNDLIIGGSGDDILDGNVGNDRLNGGAGADMIIGGTGTRDRAEYTGAAEGLRVNMSAMGQNTGDADGDVFVNVEDIFGSNFDDSLVGDRGVNWLYGRSGADVLNGQDGQDRLFGGNGDDTLYGGDAQDELQGGDGSDTLFGNQGKDKLLGGDGVDDLDGGGGNDQLFGGDGDDIIDGNIGDDRLFGGAGADELRGGTGIDTADYSTASGAIRLNLATGGTFGEADGDSYITIEWVRGSDFDDIITLDDGLGRRAYGQQGNDELYGGSGNDRIYGGAGDDYMFGGEGIDRLYAGSGNDTLFSDAGNDKLFGGSGADIFVFYSNFDRDTIYDFEDGVDLIYFDGFTEQSLLDLLANSARQVGQSVDIDLGNGHEVQIRNIDLADLTIDDFFI